MVAGIAFRWIAGIPDVCTGANTLIFRLGTDEAERTLIVNSTGRKWEFTFTTLVTFGGAFLLPSLYSIVRVLVEPIGCGC